MVNAPQSCDPWNCIGTVTFNGTHILVQFPNFLVKIVTYLPNYEAMHLTCQGVCFSTYLLLGIINVQQHSDINNIQKVETHTVKKFDSPTKTLTHLLYFLSYKTWKNSQWSFSHVGMRMLSYSSSLFPLSAFLPPSMLTQVFFHLFRKDG